MVENKLVANIIPEMTESEKNLLALSWGFGFFSSRCRGNGENGHIPILSADWLENSNCSTEEK